MLHYHHRHHHYYYCHYYHFPFHYYYSPHCFLYQHEFITVQLPNNLHFKILNLHISARVGNDVVLCVIVGVVRKEYYSFFLSFTSVVLFHVVLELGPKTKEISNTEMAGRGDMTGSLDKVREEIRPLDAADAAITEVGKLVEKFELFTSSGYAVESGTLRKKIGFQDHSEELISCLSVMRRLMEEAERENRQLKQEKFLISSKIGNALGAVNREVQILRLELQKQDKRLVELNSDSTGKLMKGPCGGDINEQLRRLEEERQRLEGENKMLSVGYHELSEKTKNLEHLREQVRTYKEDITRANETINCINSERRRLKSEKQDLVGQLKEAYCIIEDKENELRDFITTYEERMRESDKRLEIVTKEKRQWEDERRILSSNTPTQVTQLKRQLDEKDANMKELQVELSDVKDELKRLQQTLKCPVYKWDSPLSPIPKLNVQSPDSLTNCDGFSIQGKYYTFYTLFSPQMASIFHKIYGFTIISHAFVFTLLKKHLVNTSGYIFAFQLFKAVTNIVFAREKMPIP